MTRYRKAVLILPAALLSLALGCQNSEKSAKAFLAHPKVQIGMDANNSVPSCYANIGWVSVIGNSTVDWTVSPGDTNTYEVQFPFTPYPLADSSGNVVTSPITVNSSGTQSGTNKGPFTISPAANYACKSHADVGQCYFSYDIKANGQSCVQHYGSVGGYTSGIHLER